MIKVGKSVAPAALLDVRPVGVRRGLGAAGGTWEYRYSVRIRSQSADTQSRYAVRVPILRQRYAANVPILSPIRSQSDDTQPDTQ